MPYTTDLEYLEDNFQLIETLGKALKVEDDDGSLLMHNDQRKAETVVRELKAKSRSLKAKITQRMEATKTLEGIHVPMLRLETRNLWSNLIDSCWEVGRWML